MKHGENYLLTFHNMWQAYQMNNKTILATFLEEVNEMYLFKDIHGEFAITKKKISNKEITVKMIED